MLHSMDSMSRIAFYMTEAEYKWILLQAGEVPLSKWCKKRVLEGLVERAEDHRSEKLPRTRAVSVVGRSVDAREPMELGGVTAFSQCASCGHPKHKHHGYGNACQEDMCRCGGYRDT